MSSAGNEARRFSALDRLAQVRVVHLSAVTSLDASVVALLLRCIQQVQRQHPGRGLQVVGSSPRGRAGLEVTALDTLVDFAD